jgi:hypothetical protein
MKPRPMISTSNCSTELVKGNRLREEQERESQTAQETQIDDGQSEQRLFIQEAQLVDDIRPGEGALGGILDCQAGLAIHQRGDNDQADWKEAVQLTLAEHQIMSGAIAGEDFPPPAAQSGKRQGGRRAHAQPGWAGELTAVNALNRLDSRRG